MWDDTPAIDALFGTLHPSVQAETEAARSHLARVVLGHGERRPVPVLEGLQEQVSRPKGFVYDRITQLLFRLDWADHERCAGCLMLARELRGPVDWEAAFNAGTLSNGEAAQRYLDQGHGFIANSPQLTAKSGEWPLHVGADVTLTAQEKTWFRGMRIDRA